MRATHTATRMRSTSCRPKMSGSRRRTGTARRCRPTRRRRMVFRTQGNGTSGTGWNYYNNGFATQSSWPVECRQRQPGTQRHLRHDGQRLGMDGKPVQRAELWRRFVAWVAWRLLELRLQTSWPRPPATTTTRRTEDSLIGFRVASVPEPGSLVMLAGVRFDGVALSVSSRGSRMALWRPIPFLCESLPVARLPLAASAPCRPAEGHEQERQRRLLPRPLVFPQAALLQF